MFSNTVYLYLIFKNNTNVDSETSGLIVKRALVSLNLEILPDSLKFAKFKFALQLMRGL